MNNFALKFKAVAHKTAKIHGALFYAAPYIYHSKKLESSQRQESLLD